MPAGAAGSKAATSAAAAAAAAAASAAAAAAMPPRSATIMGMPTIKMPAGTAPATPAVTPVKPATMPIAAAAVPAVIAPQPATTTPGTSSTAGRAPAPRATDVPAVAAVTPAAAAPALAIAGGQRSPMISGIATKRSALVERTLQKMAARLAETAGLEPGSPELLALLKLSTEVVERIVWEVVPDLAEQIIRENLHDLTARRS